MTPGLGVSAWARIRETFRIVTDTLTGILDP